jgi:hypothetical protein
MQTLGGQDHQQFGVNEILNFFKIYVLFSSFASSLLLGRYRPLLHHTSSIPILLGSTALKNQNGRLGVALDGTL